ncbi:ATP-binding protein [Streptomyces sp. NBC_01387]|uniref:ATP-binding protein n=1 Tax=unclassified Streptomyces TaxID=2593676 RepID=UPI0020259C92|nr:MULTISPECIES: ATP-binding protein [unclassified Streptomyces]MCX4548426.1 ATP-binding protein [Streptomyces sp. NBC_01500]WSC20047.1 ATP-binding protein [Streptomyces sp. NBC_01766]WSV54068.1 ATP-binding protein [Streptomyces sp. NBC_01014]
MSLSLPRRIARTALLIAAGAVPVVAAAGVASAAELPQTPNLGGVTALDGAGLGNSVDGAAQKATGLAGDTGGKAVNKAVPTAGKAVGAAGRTAVPAAQQAAGDTAATAAGVVGGAAQSATDGGLSAGGQPTGGLPLG